MEEIYLWRHWPLISSPPVEQIFFNSRSDKDFVEQKAVLKLENQKYLYIRYSGVLTDPKSGITDIEEFESLEEATEVYNEF